jgi:hypothetical protein
MRCRSTVTPLVAECLAGQVPTADKLDVREQYVVDGTLLPCWSWAAYPELYSGKHKTTGMNVQVACTIYGQLAWISDPINGSRHDNHCLGESGVLQTLTPKNWIGDKGYVGNGMITPFKKPAGGKILDWQKKFNTQVNKIRWTIEQVISHFKNWRIMHTETRQQIRRAAATAPGPRCPPGLTPGRSAWRHLACRLGRQPERYKERWITEIRDDASSARAASDPRVAYAGGGAGSSKTGDGGGLFLVGRGSAAHAVAIVWWARRASSSR